MKKNCFFFGTQIQLCQPTQRAAPSTRRHRNCGTKMAHWWKGCFLRKKREIRLQTRHTSLRHRLRHRKWRQNGANRRKWFFFKTYRKDMEFRISSSCRNPAHACPVVRSALDRRRRRGPGAARIDRGAHRV